MKHLKIMGLCLVAVFALSAVVAASASAAEFELVKAGTKEPLAKKKFSGTGKKGILETAKNGTIACENSSFGGEIEGTKSGKATITFTGCVGAGFKCNSVGAKNAGEIITSVTLGLVFGGGHILLLLTLLPLTEPKTVTLECTSLQKLIIKGGFVTLAENSKGEALKVNESSTVLRIHPKQTKGAQEFTKFKKSSTGAEESITLETKGEGVKTFGFEKSGEEAEAIEGKFEEAFEVIEK